MKICAIGLRGIPNVMGGIESHCQNLYPLLLKNSDDLDIVVLARRPYVDPEPYLYKGVRVKPIWSLKNKYLETILHTAYAVLHARFVEKADLVHLHAIGPGLLTPLARLLGLKVLVTHHGEDFNRQKWNRFAKAMLRFGEAASLRFGNRIVVVGRTLTQKLQQRFARKADQIEFVPNGVPPEVAERDLKKTVTYSLPSELGIDPKRPYILCVGRLVPEKGFQDVIAAFKKLENPPLQLVIVGGTDHEDEFYADLRAEQSDQVIFTGFQRGDALKALYQNASLFVLPSYHEGMPIVALEAISWNLPVLLSDIEPNLDIGLPERCYFKVGDIDDLKSKIDIADFEDYACDHEKFIAQYNWERIAIQMRDVLKKMGYTPSSGQPSSSLNQFAQASDIADQ